MKDEKKASEKVAVRWTGYVALAFALLFFSGFFMNMEGPLKVLDYSNILGKFGNLGTLTEGAGALAPNFKGLGGKGPREAFLLALTIVPQIMLALGVIKIIENYDGLKAAEKLLTPFMRFILGLPGSCALGVIASLQSSDAGASFIKSAYDEGIINEKEKLVFCAFQYPAAGTIVNYFALGGALFASLGNIPVALPLLSIIVCKLIGANIIRFLANKIVKDTES